MTDRGCRTCGAALGGPSQGRYCSPPCRRKQEFLRRRWGRGAAAVRAAEQNALLPERSPEQREAWFEQARRLRAALGPRP